MRIPWSLRRAVMTTLAQKPEPSLPVALGDLELGVRVAALAVLLGVEGREVLADDLLGRVALDPPGARVPGEHPALAVEQEDRVVGHGLDEQPELLGDARCDRCLLQVAGAGFEPA